MTEDLRRGSWLGRHELLLRIGRGGMATVWVAREHTEKVEDQRLLAVKAILADLAGDPEFVKMFLDEGRLVQSIRHPNVVDVYEVGEHDGVMYMSMEWVEGDSLHSVIAEAGKRRPIPAEMAVRIIADAAAGLHAAHEAKGEDGQLLGVVHRDVSPHNILLGTDGAIKLVDFGVAKAMGRLSEATSAGQLKGKFGYMSPEQAMAKPIDRRSDVFSLGIVLFELTTGRRLFRGEHDAETLHLVVSGQIPNPSKINDKYPKKLEQIVLKALERDVERRYQTAEEFQKDLEGYLKEERILVPRNGIAALLKRVMGTRIEQRRKAVRAALKAVSSDAQSGAPLLSSDPAFAGGDHISVTGVSGVSGAGSDSGISSTGNGAISNSGVSQPSSVTGSCAGVSQNGMSTVPQTVSHHGTPSRGGLLGYVVGIGGLLVAIGVVVFFATSQRHATTKVLNVSAGPGAQAVEPSAAPPPRPTASDDVPTVSVDTLKDSDAGAAPGHHTQRAVHQHATPAHTASKTPPKPTAKKKPPAPADTAGLPRANPYGK
jgi:serine/threonine-protein kinase